MERSRSGNPVGLGLVIVGAIAMAVAAFLPLAEPTGAFRLVRENTLIQHGGWMLIAVAVGIAASGFWASQGKAAELVWLPASLCVVAAIGIVFWATNKDLRTLYPIGFDGTVDTSQPAIVTPLGVAIYVAGAGVAVALIGSLMLSQSGRPGAGPRVRPRGSPPTVTGRSWTRPRHGRR